MPVVFASLLAAQCEPHRALSIVTDRAAACLIDEERRLWCWGDNVYGIVDPSDPVGLPGIELPPHRIGDWTDVQRVALSASHACALRGDGSVWCWGRSEDGEVDEDGTPRRHRAPVRTSGEGTYDRVAVTSGTTCMRSSAGAWHCVGVGLLHSILDPATASAPPTPGRFEVPRVAGAEQLAIRYDEVAALSPAGGGVAWEGAHEPGPVPDLADAVELGVGSSHVCAVRASGAVACWSASTPWPPDSPHYAPLRTFTVRGIDDARAFTGTDCVRRADGSVACWGYVRDEFGNFQGPGEARRVEAPDGSTLVAAGTDARACAIAAGGQITCRLPSVESAWTPVEIPR